MLFDAEGDPGQRRAHFPGLALQSVPQDKRGETEALADLGTVTQGHQRGRDEAEVVGGQRSWLWGLVTSLGETTGNRGRKLDAVMGDDRAGILEGRTVRNRGAAGDDAGVVAGDVTDRQSDDGSGRGGGSKPAALDAGQVLPQGVHLVDVC